MSHYTESKSLIFTHKSQLYLPGYTHSSDEADSDDDDSAIVKEWQDRGPFNRFNQIEHRLAHDNFDVGIYDFPDDDEYEEYLSDEDELEEYIDKVQAGTKVQVSLTYSLAIV